MRYVLGTLFLATAGWLVLAARAKVARRLAERRSAGIADDAMPTSRLYEYGEVARSAVLFFVAYVAIKGSFMFMALDAQRYLSLLDLAGFLAALGAYAYYLVRTTKYPAVALYRAAQAASVAEVGSAANAAPAAANAAHEVELRQAA